MSAIEMSSTKWEPLADLAEHALKESLRFSYNTGNPFLKCLATGQPDHQVNSDYNNLNMNKSLIVILGMTLALIIMSEHMVSCGGCPFGFDGSDLVAGADERAGSLLNTIRDMESESHEQEVEEEEDD
ncbi:unnamed protein product [Oppiella nova]|uniref:Uncharacterized protein n=1 Tax=Oppiella nova TaxID=334625 RepID=A0A7R9QXN8_9ACAR|nr:unnamed protein product [Oppiella nova]CAG2177890.1 unnamed protein product [Oppiella nova]